MYDIFISYRRKDNPDFADQVYGRLCDKFAAGGIFYDKEEIQPGDLFPQRIKDAVAECNVVLLIVGKDWLELNAATRQSRLWAEEDWVRQEIALALATGKKIIPILAQNADLPAASDLPPDVAAIVNSNFHKFGGTSEEQKLRWAKLLKQLVKLVSGAETELHTQLTLLCDRAPQMDKVRAQLGALGRLHSPRPAVFVLPGEADEAHGAFLKRVEWGELREWLKKNRVSGDPFFLRIPPELPLDSQPGFAGKFRQLLARGISFPGSDGSDAELVSELKAAYRQVAGTVVVVLEVRSKEQMGTAHLLIEWVAQYWRDFPELPGNLTLVTFVCLKFEPAAERSWFSNPFSSRARLAKAEKILRARVKNLANSLEADSRLHFRLLPELQPPRLPDIDGWLADPKVQKAIQDRDVPEARRRRVLLGCDCQPMDVVLVELEVLLCEYSGRSQSG